jgi:undecaprenyl-diphosphatase
LVAADGFSYPSGHATLSVAYLAIAVVLARAAPLTMRVALIVSGLVATIVVGLSRAYLQVHWLSDVGGGWAVGLASYSICGMIALVAGYVRLNWSDARAATAPGREAARSARAAARDRAS